MFHFFFSILYPSNATDFAFDCLYICFDFCFSDVFLNSRTSGCCCCYSNALNTAFSAFVFSVFQSKCIFESSNTLLCVPYRTYTDLASSSRSDSEEKRKLLSISEMVWSDFHITLPRAHQIPTNTHTASIVSRILTAVCDLRRQDVIDDGNFLQIGLESV